MSISCRVLCPSDKIRKASSASAVVCFASPHCPSSMKSSIDLVVTLPKPGKHHEHQLQGALPSDKTQTASLASAVVRFASPRRPSSMKSSIKRCPSRASIMSISCRVPSPSDKTRKASSASAVVRFASPHRPSSMKSSVNPVMTLPKPSKHHEHQLQGALPL